MKRLACAIAATALVCAVALIAAFSPPASEQENDAAAAIDSGKLPPPYRDWRLISLAREEGHLDQAIKDRDFVFTRYAP